jgi:hypothetical protein
MNVYVSVCRTVSRYGSAALESTQVLSRVENNGVTYLTLLVSREIMASRYSLVE